MWQISDTWVRQQQIRLAFTKELKRLNSENACYHSVQNLPSYLIYMNVNSK
jgi:hypothetical protein